MYYTLGQRQLARSLFPLEGLTKAEVRRLAREAGLANHAKKDSTGICFIGERRFTDFLQQYLPAQPGEIHSLEGEYLGDHQGLMYYTIGQRQGLGIGGLKDSSGDPWYVVAKDIERNRLVVAQGNHHPALFQPSLVAADLHWIAGRPPAATTRSRISPIERMGAWRNDCSSRVAITTPSSTAIPPL